MIRAKDWIVFLENDVPLEELPIPKEHMSFCLRRLQKREAAKDINPIHQNSAKLEKVVKDNEFVFQNYPPCVYIRKDPKTNVYDFDPWHKVRTFIIPQEPHRL